ncbi:WGR domain-containing protein [Pelobacter propionicus]|uniref:WGR domain protein n=1 Tax=Pelobacter propionicus (strain DSM 2379 / NBRC 103807 / OttBd1) TaxID=338966 RepID=A0R7W4_PELPD|nr:WGR domain-containing protein [Pelobacter propionicus]ABL01321.1 WGR domain protein [Pelobacter propionicus DSM 2379]
MANPDYFVLLEKQTSGPTGGKFWIVEVYGSKVILSWGPIGKMGQKREKNFSNPTAATIYATARENEKLSNGYSVQSRNRPQPSTTKVAAKPSTKPKPVPVKIKVSKTALTWDF